MASGVDGSGHTGALCKNGYTCAVLGCGVDICYPKSNSRIYQEILEKNGAIISEYPPGTNPSAPLFPARNRIIAGLADVVVIVEAKIKSRIAYYSGLCVRTGKGYLCGAGAYV